MNLVVHIPDDLAERIGGDLERQAREALAIEAHRSGRLSEADMRRMIGSSPDRAMDGLDAESGEAKALQTRRRMSVDQMLAFATELTALPLLDPRSPRAIMEDLDVL
jgi:hypothetical protein